MKYSAWSRFLSVSLLVLSSASLSAQQSPAPVRAVPVEEDAPVTAPKAIPKAIPVSPPSEASAPGPAAGKPKSPEDDLFDYASMLYERQEYELATQSLAKYLQNYPNGSHVALAMFRIGECFMKQNQLKKAETYYMEVVTRYPNSEGVPSAAYRLGAMRFNVKDFETSARYFALCEKKSPLPQVRLASAFNRARAYQMMGDIKGQMAALATVIAEKKDNPYREAALLTLGTTYLAQDRKTDALPLFLDLIQESKDPAVLSEAYVKAGVLHGEMGKPEEALPLFRKAVDMPETTAENRSIAMVGMVQADFSKGNYDAVINAYSKHSSALPEGDTRPKLLLLVGNAYRMKKSYSRAVEIYLQIEQGFPTTEQAFEAGYWKVYCFYLLDDKDLGEFAMAFIQRYGSIRPDHEFVNLARLIRADYFFNKKDYVKAAESFNEVQIARLSEKLRPGTAFNHAWSLAEAQRRPEAIDAFTKFLTDYPGHEFMAKALARRGLIYRDAGDTVRAVNDFQRVVKEYLHSDAAEIAYLQMGSIAMDQRDPKAVIAAFEMLVKKFPSSQAAAQAWYGIGRSYLELKQWEKAIPALQKSLDIDGKTYADRSGQMLIQAYYYQQDVGGLAKTIDGMRAANPNAAIPPNVLTWVGLKLFDQKLYARSTKYLALATTPDVPGNTDPRVWNYLGMAFLETKDYASSITATDNFLAVTPESAAKARGLLIKGKALLGLGKLVEAETVVKEGLTFAKDGKPQALLLILEGDILLASAEALLKENRQGEAKAKYSAAAGKFMIPAQFFEDEDVTPEALSKAAKALEAAGQKSKAGEFRETLKAKYPAYKAAE